MSKKISSGIRVHRMVEQHIALLTEAGNELRAEPKIALRLNSLTRGIPYEWDLDDRMRFNHDTLVSVGDLMGEVGVCEMWKRNGRIAYDIHEELGAALYRSRMEAIPGSVFDRLPHINPLVILPDPWPVEGIDAWVRGFLVFGWVGTALCDTNDPQCEGLGVMFIYEGADEDTGEIVPLRMRDLMPLPTSREKISVNDALEFAEGWVGNTDFQSAPAAPEHFKPLLRAAFSVITYLCCDNRDVEELATNQRRKKTGKGRKPRDPFYIRVGWYVGPALHASRQRSKGSARQLGVSIPSGVEYGPQHRAGHFKTAHYGTGRQFSRTVWVEPYWTKREELEPGQDPVTQIVPVNPQRHDPLRRRGIK